MIADLLVLVHLCFIGFVMVGALLLVKRPWLVVFHLPAITWAALLEFNSWVCPLTPWEQQLRHVAGQQGYTGGFVEHYLLPVLYPSGLTPNLQIILGGVVVLVNLFIYGWLLWRKRPILK